MAIVNGIVTICKAIINVRHRHTPAHTSTANKQLTRISTGHCRFLLTPRQLLDLRQGRRRTPKGHNKRCLEALSTHTATAQAQHDPHLTERSESHNDWQAGSARDRATSFLCDTLVKTTTTHPAFWCFLALRKDDLRERERWGWHLHAPYPDTHTLDS